MPILDPVSVPTKGTALYFGTTLVGGASGISGFGSGSANKIDVTTLASGRMITRKGLIEEGSVSIDGIFAPQSAVAKELEDALQAQSGYNWTINVGGALDAAGLSQGLGTKVRTGIAFSTIEADANVSATAYKITLGDADLLPAITDGDGITIDAGTDVHKVIRVGVESGNGVVWVENATAITDADGGTVDLVRPAIQYQFSGTVDAFTRDMATNEVMRFSLTIGSIAGIVDTVSLALA